MKGVHMEKELMEELRKSVFDYDEEAAEKVAKRWLELKMDPYKAITGVLTPAIRPWVSNSS